MLRLDGKVALITGGSRGQGASHAERLATEGATVVCADVLDDAGAGTAARLCALGLAVEYVHLDVTSADDWSASIAAIADRHGRLDVLVNNAGIIHVNPLTE